MGIRFLLEVVKNPKLGISDGGTALKIVETIKFHILNFL